MLVLDEVSVAYSVYKPGCKVVRRVASTHTSFSISAITTHFFANRHIDQFAGTNVSVRYLTVTGDASLFIFIICLDVKIYSSSKNYNNGRRIII